MRRRLLNIKRGGGFDFTSDLMAYWKLATNSLDSSGRGHNGTDVGVVYSAGYADFTSGRVSISDSDDLSFTDGTNDLKAHILLSFIWDSKTGTQIIFSKRTPNLEYQIASNGTDLYFRLYSLDNSSYIIITINLSLISTGVLNTLQFTYDGSKSHTGIKAYLNGNNEIGTTSMVGTYIRSVNTTSGLELGGTFTNSFNFKGKAKEWAIWKGRTMTPEEITEIDRRVKAGEPLI